MNLLAHALLSPPNDPAALFGNLTADWVKGRARLCLPANIRRGMEIHQRIDVFTDMHPNVQLCADLLEEKWGRYAPILVDVLFDHVLSLEWARHCRTGRTKMIATVYAALRDHRDLLPERAQFAVNALLADDWLTGYATLDGIALALSRMSARLRSRGHEFELAHAVRDFQAVQTEFHAAFNAFFPQLRVHVATVSANPAAAGKLAP